MYQALNMLQIKTTLPPFRPKGCFLDAEGGTRQVLKIPFDKCGVKQMVGEEEGWIGHTLVVQHDDWLIFPGRVYLG